MDARGRLSGTRGLVARLEGGSHCRLPLRGGYGERGDLMKLLLGEGHPALQLGIELRLIVEVDRRVNERARGGDLEIIAAARFHGPLDDLEGAPQVRAPDIAAIHHAERERSLRRQGAQ